MFSAPPRHAPPPRRRESSSGQSSGRSSGRSSCRSGPGAIAGRAERQNRTGRAAAEPVHDDSVCGRPAPRPGTQCLDGQLAPWPRQGRSVAGIAGRQAPVRRAATACYDKEPRVCARADVGSSAVARSARFRSRRGYVRRRASAPGWTVAAPRRMPGCTSGRRCDRTRACARSHRHPRCPGRWRSR